MLYLFIRKITNSQLVLSLYKYDKRKSEKFHKNKKSMKMFY